MTQVKQALVSLQLQLNNHCRQERLLKEKWKRCEIEEEKKKQEQAKLLHERQTQETSENGKLLTGKIKSNAGLFDGKKVTECLQSSSLVISAENFSVSSTSSLSDCGAPSKDEKTTINDLEGQVRDLQMQVLSLSQNLEDCNRENSRLKRALDNVREFVKSKFGYELDDNVFDFHLLKSQCLEGPETFSENANLKILSPGDNISSHEDVTLKAIEDESRNGSDIDEDIPLPPLEAPQFTYEDECGENSAIN